MTLLDDPRDTLYRSAKRGRESGWPLWVSVLAVMSLSGLCWGLLFVLGPWLWLLGW